MDRELREAVDGFIGCIAKLFWFGNACAVPRSFLWFGDARTVSRSFFVFCDEGEKKADDIGTMARSESVRVSKMLTMGELLVF